MRLLPVFILLLTLVSSCGTREGESTINQVSITPVPAQLTAGIGYFSLGDDVSIGTNSEETRQIGRFYADYLQLIGKNSTVGTNGDGDIVLKLDANLQIKNEGYQLSVTKEGVKISAASGAGLFYGIQSLIQLTSVDEQATRIPVVNISDQPRFEWRGLHLDVCRHFFPVEFVKKYLDLMSHYKLNTFHWHLTEDQGWRIEIKKYPKLQEVAAFRKETLVGHYSDQPHRFDGTRYGGYYTQEEVREVVAYAAERFITVVPEIEMPGHSLAALSAYPELGCTGGPYEAATKWGVFDDVYCAGKESTFEFLQGVLDEVIELFPGKYIHIGGDECPKTRWKTCKDCQKRIKDEGLKDEHELQSYFIQRIEKYLNSKGRAIIGWDEILEGGLAPNASVMSWRGEAGGIAAAQSGHDVVMTPGFALYFDHYNSQPDGEPVAIGGFTPVRKVYDYDPVPPTLSDEEAKHILGAQANVWTEYILSPDHVEYMVYPRALALSEVVWSPKASRNWENFSERLERQYELLSQWDVNYRRQKPGDNEPLSFINIALKNESGEPLIGIVRLMKAGDPADPFAQDTTDRRGYAQFRFLEPTRYTIVTSLDGYQEERVELDSIKSWATVYKEIVLKKN